MPRYSAGGCFDYAKAHLLEVGALAVGVVVALAFVKGNT